MNKENWDSEMPEQKGFNLTEGKHEIKITGNTLFKVRHVEIHTVIFPNTEERRGACIELVNTRFADEKTGKAKKALRITGNTKHGGYNDAYSSIVLSNLSVRDMVPDFYPEPTKKHPSTRAPVTSGITYDKTSPS